MERLQELPMIDITDNETGCCPRFHPENWDEKIIRLDNMLFAKANSRSFLYMPINLGKVMRQSMKAIEKAVAADPKGYLILSKDISSWRAEHYYLVSKPVPEMNMTTIQGEFLMKTYSAPYQEIPKLIKEFALFMEDKGYELALEDLYIFYTTCPKCAKVYGKNYMVLFGKLGD